MSSPPTTLEAIMVGNTQGLYTKFNQGKVPCIKELPVEVGPMLIAITETHLGGEVKDAKISITHYTPNKTDRETRRHGGVVIYIRNDLAENTKQVVCLQWPS